MFSDQITHRNIFRVLIAGFGLVIVLLLTAGFVGVKNVQSSGRARRAWFPKSLSPPA
jgi:hypothetical protein